MPQEESTLSENFSDNVKRRRGRPALFDRSMSKMLDDGLQYTKRHQQNQYYTLMFSLVVPDERRSGDLAWLFEGSDKPRYKRSTILAELGRLAFSNVPGATETANALASEIAGKQMPTSQALALIRQYRRSIEGTVQRPAHPDQLADEIIRTINDYSRRHPDMKQSTTLRALRIVATIAQQTHDKDSTS